jgi:hypothetical protein
VSSKGAAIGNEGARQQERCLMPQMTSKYIDDCCRTAGGSCRRAAICCDGRTQPAFCLTRHSPRAENWEQQFKCWTKETLARIPFPRTSS